MKEAGPGADEDWGAARAELARARGVVVLTGAGISAASGIPTFRDTGGLWDGVRVEELATPEGFEADPERVWRWYGIRRRAIRSAGPNAAHRAVAELQHRRGDVTVVTQNVDGLHDRALSEAEGPQEGGRQERSTSPEVLSLHGSILATRCHHCGRQAPEGAGVRDGEPGDVGGPPALPRCSTCGGPLRPGVVWFGEALPAETLDRAFRQAAEAELCLVVGTSAIVHPAASVPLQTLESGGRLWEVNPETTPLSRLAHRRFAGEAHRILPRLLGPPDEGHP